MVMTTSDNGLNLIKSFEGFRNEPYLDVVGVPTIGYGTTVYPNGAKVSMGDRQITEQQANSYLQHDLINFEDAVNNSVISAINQNQFDALIDFTYNLGIANFKGSTLLKLVNKNPGDRTIASEFMKWVDAGGKVISGLVKRRQVEADLYFTVA